MANVYMPTTDGDTIVVASEDFQGAAEMNAAELAEHGIEQGCYVTLDGVNYFTPWVLQDVLNAFRSAQASEDAVQPPSRDVSGAGDAFDADDIGGTVFVSTAGACTLALPSLAAGLIAGRAIVLTVQATDPASAVTIDPGVGVSIDGSTGNFVAPVGKSRISLLSDDGLTFFSGTP